MSGKNTKKKRHPVKTGTDLKIFHGKGRKKHGTLDCSKVPCLHVLIWNASRFNKEAKHVIRS